MQSLWYILLVGVVLSLDAFTVGVTNGISESRMKFKKTVLIALFYGVFQCIMPLIGYFAGSILSDFIEKFAHWVSFILLIFIGGKMIFDSIKDMLKFDKSEEEDDKKERELSISKLTLQAVATSIDAMAIGVTMLACEVSGELFANVWIDSSIIGVITFGLCLIAVNLGKFAGSKIKVPAASQLIGGVVLVLLGVKILLQGLGIINIGF